MASSHSARACAGLPSLASTRAYAPIVRPRTSTRRSRAHRVTSHRAVDMAASPLHSSGRRGIITPSGSSAAPIARSCSVSRMRACPGPWAHTSLRCRQRRTASIRLKCASARSPRWVAATPAKPNSSAASTSSSGGFVPGFAARAALNATIASSCRPRPSSAIALPIHRQAASAETSSAAGSGCSSASSNSRGNHIPLMCWPRRATAVRRHPAASTADSAARARG